MKKKGFTLIELLIVVAIIAILAAIAVPNFLEAQVRSKVSRVKTDQRSLATGLESYFVDNNDYPTYTNMDTRSANNLGKSPTTNSAKIHSFRVRAATTDLFLTLTTPIAYITNYFSDPFADTKGSTFGYYTDQNGWILYSFGPDTDEGTSERGDIDSVVETLYTSRMSQPSVTLQCNGITSTVNGAYTYDPSNGTVSQGDVYRVKQ